MNDLFTLYCLEVEATKKQQEVDKKAIDDLVRERDILNKVIYLYFQFFNLIAKIEIRSIFLLMFKSFRKKVEDSCTAEQKNIFIITFAGFKI